MGGLLFLLLCGVGFVAALLLSQVFSRRGKLLFWLLFAALVFGDSFVGHLVQDRLCEDAVRIRIHRQVRDVSGVDVPFSIGPNSSDTYGYSLVEHYDVFSGRDRVRRVDGRLIYEQRVALEAPYALSVHETRMNRWFVRRTYFTHSRDSTERLGEFGWILFRGGWLERLMMIFEDSGPRRYVSSCQPERDERRLAEELLRATLVPTP